MDKRFLITVAGEYLDTETDKWLTIEEVFDLMNNQDNEIQAQVIVIKGYQERNEKLFKKTQELQERNDRQAEQLDNLYTLIEKEDWGTLQRILQEFKECEEQLQKEWSGYQ